jgi:hypothetical protein
MISTTLTDSASTLNLPFEVFSNFEVLELKSYHFKTTPKSNSQHVLKSLTLNKVCIISNNFQDILSRCSCLENLTLEKCNFFRNKVKITSPSLKYIKIYNVYERNILVSTINVEFFEIESISCSPKELVFETPKLHVLCSYNGLNRIGQDFLPNGHKLLKTILLRPL